MKKFKATTQDQKVLNEEQFSTVFMEYLQILDEFDAQLLTTKEMMERIRTLRYYVDAGLVEHQELSKKLYKNHEEHKMKEKSSKLA